MKVLPMMKKLLSVAHGHNTVNVIGRLKGISLSSWFGLKRVNLLHMRNPKKFSLELL